nr:DNA topoisomerase 2 isoform X1 [Tanacetum cinerariifolium]
MDMGIRPNDKKINHLLTMSLQNIRPNILLDAVNCKQGANDIRVMIDAADNLISVWSNCEGLHDLTSTNYSEALQYSTDFTIERDDGNKVSKQVFNNTMGQNLRHAKRKSCSRKKSTMVSFKPDLVKLRMRCLEHDIVALMKRRVVDLAGCCSRVKVELDGTCIPPKTFRDYVEIYLQTSTHTTRYYEKVNDRWEICVAIADGHLEHFDQVSFVNNIATMNGGSHVSYITRQITNYVAQILNLEPNDIKRYLWVFVNAHIDDPTFDSQTKLKLTTNKGSFGSTCELTQEFLKKIADSDVFKCFKSNLGNINVGNFDIPELRDANLAGTPSSQYCTLILTKGDYAKDIAMSRLSVVGQDKYGVFPLKASPQQLEKNTQIQNIKKILGLQYGKIYENVKELRYGHLMIIADEDYDGLQMKGLLINFLHFFWPSLLKVESFLQMLIAPIIKASHKKTNKVFLFYSTPEYEAWCKKEKLQRDYNIKYYELLETIKEREDRGEYCFDQHIKDFVWVNDEDYNAIELVFSNKKIEARKRWLLKPEDVTLFDPRQKCIRYLDFINQEFKQYAIADIQRSIPSMVDGLKPHQRKILFYALKNPIIQRTQVDHFCSYVFEHSPYDVEGEASLVDTIIGMAQNYVGSNNINLLRLNGQFGTRVMGGKDHGVGTLLFTQLSPITPYLFHKDDQLLLNYLNEGGQSIEPACYVPIIPMVLVNGSEARGTWSSFIPNYNPRDIIANLKRRLKGEGMVDMLPWYKGFEGDIKETASNEYTTKGIITQDIDAHIISELPVRCWTRDYKNFLDALSQGGRDIKAYKPYKARHDTTRKYDTPKQILEDFFHIRLYCYEKRRTTLLCKLKKDVLVVESKLRFIKGVRNLDLALKSKDERKGRNQEEQDVDVTGYDYLLSIPLLTLKAKDMKELEEEHDAMNKKIVYLQDASIKSLWLRDLDALEKQLVLEGYPEANIEAEKNSKTSMTCSPTKREQEETYAMSDSDEESEEQNMCLVLLTMNFIQKCIAFGMCLSSYLSLLSFDAVFRMLCKGFGSGWLGRCFYYIEFCPASLQRNRFARHIFEIFAFIWDVGIFSILGTVLVCWGMMVEGRGSRGSGGEGRRKRGVVLQVMAGNQG